MRSSFYLKWWESEYLVANDKELKEYSKFMGEAISAGLGFVFDFEKVIIVIPMPRFHKNTNRQLHSENEPAVKWLDGFEEYYLFGVKFEKELWEKITSKTILAIDVLKLGNIEQRYAALKILGSEKLLQELNAELIDKSSLGNELYKIDGVIPNKSIRLLKYVCPSTGRVYTKFVPFGAEKADEAQAQSHKFALKEYLSLTKQS